MGTRNIKTGLVGFIWEQQKVYPVIVLCDVMQVGFDVDRNKTRAKPDEPAQRTRSEAVQSRKRCCQ